MDITWYGHSCFRITERGKANIVTDPYDESIGYGALNLKSEIVTISHNTPGHANVEAVRDWQYLIERPGEYEIGGVFIIATPMINKKVADARYNLAYTFDYGKSKVVHMGDIQHVPSQSDLDALGEVNVLLVPVGGGGALNASQAAEVVAMIEPSIVIPMHYKTDHSLLELDPVDKFLTEMGVSQIEPQESLRVSSSSTPEQTEVMMLAYNN